MAKKKKDKKKMPDTKFHPGPFHVLMFKSLRNKPLGLDVRIMVILGAESKQKESTGVPGCW